MRLSGRLRTVLFGVMTGVLAASVIHPHHHHPRPTPPPVVVYEDGSGVQYEGDQEVRTFPEGTFVWDCHRMGNRICGRP